MFKIQTWNSIKERLKNKGTILALAGGIVTILIQFGFKVDSEQVMTVVEAVCGLLILMGIMNNPVGNTAAYIPGVSDQLVEKPSKIEEPKKTSDEVAAEKSTEVSNVKIPVVEEQLVNQVEDVK